MRRYSAHITAGDIAEVLLDYSNDEDWGSNPCLPSMVDLACLTEAQRQVLAIEFGYKIKQNHDWLAYNKTWCQNYTSIAASHWYICESSLDASGTPSTLPFPEECLYAYSIMSRNNVDIFLPILLNGVISQSRGDATYSGPTLLEVFTTNDDSNELFNTSFEKFSQKLSNLATSMTNRIRVEAPEDIERDIPHKGDAAFGIIWQAGTCVQVRWWWLVYPVLSLLMSLAFLCAILLQARRETGRRSCMRDWRSAAPLSLVIPSLSESEGHRDTFARPLTERQIGILAKDMNVRLVVDERGWRFVVSGQKSAGNNC